MAKKSFFDGVKKGDIAVLRCGGKIVIKDIYLSSNAVRLSFPHTPPSLPLTFSVNGKRIYFGNVSTYKDCPFDIVEIEKMSL